MKSRAALYFDLDRISYDSDIDSARLDSHFPYLDAKLIGQPWKWVEAGHNLE
jgi:hypothetical protein